MGGSRHTLRALTSTDNDNYDLLSRKERWGGRSLRDVFSSISPAHAAVPLIDLEPSAAAMDLLHCCTPGPDFDEEEPFLIYWQRVSAAVQGFMVECGRV